MRAEPQPLVVEHLDDVAERILEAAGEALAEHGLRRTSMDDFARLAGVSRATLFRRFPNRDVLLRSLALREAQRVISQMDAQVAGLATPEERVIAGFVAFIRALRGHRLLRRLLVTDPERMLPLLTTDGEPVLTLGRAYAEGMLLRAQQEGALLTAEPAQLAEIFARLGLSLVLTPQSVLPLDDEAQLAAFARHALAPLALQRPD